MLIRHSRKTFPSLFCTYRKFPSYLIHTRHNVESVQPSDSYITRGDLFRLFSEIGSYREVKEYLQKYTSAGHFAVIKVGGAVLMNDLDELVETLSFLQHVGLTPVVVHGAGPQVNETLERDKVVFDYVDGQRITTPEILTIVRRIVFEQNSKLVEALEKKGTRARPLLTGVFTAETMKEPDLGLVGNITKVNRDLVLASARDGCIPILSCLASTSQGNALNVNADFAALELAKSLKPMKVVWISGKGGIADQDGEIINTIDLSDDYDRLMHEPWFKHGDKLKLRLVKDLLSQLPASSSVSITTPGKLSRELFTHRGDGTLICRREAIDTLYSLDKVDLTRLQDLLEDSFDGTLVEDYFDSIKDHIKAIYLSDNYNGVAIVTSHPTYGYDVLDKFAVGSRSQSDGLGARLFKKLKENHAISFWRSRKVNDGRANDGPGGEPINSWYFKVSTFSYSVPDTPWIIFGYGDAVYDHHKEMIDYLASKPATILRSGDEVKISLSDPVYTVQDKIRVGLIGARGYTGDELLQIIDKHDKFEIAAVGSRKFEGKRACDVMSTSSNVMVTNITKEHVKDKSNLVDVWILALPNGLAKDYAAEIPPHVSAIDLSADFRWDPVDLRDPNWNSYWQYGLPERVGNRSRISNANRVANPGCYASAMQLSLYPLAAQLQEKSPIVKIINSPHCFGISGFSGAGTTPSDKNDPAIIKDNIVPYALANHGHEREVSHQLQPYLSNGIFFTPHVAQFFRGINMTTSIDFDPSYSIPTEQQIIELFETYYQNEPFVEIQSEIPHLTSVTGKHTCVIGGFKVDPERGRIVIVSVIDNLLKGAASVCVQNLNLMFGFPETTGLMPKSSFKASGMLSE